MFAVCIIFVWDKPEGSQLDKARELFFGNRQDQNLIGVRVLGFSKHEKITQAYAKV